MTEVFFNGSEGRLEGRYHHSEKKGAPAALILHPHPQYGGTMNNKVTYTLFHTFAKLGFSVLRFNFRSVGRSQGQFEGGPGELSDAATALDWLQQQNEDAKNFWIGGYSFGAWIGMQLLMRRPEIKGFISVAPPAGEKDFSFLAPCPSSGIIIQGGRDDIVNPSASATLAKRLNGQRNIKVEYGLVPDADHAFSNSLADLHRVAGEYIIRKARIKSL